ncbi:type I-E CRISPR-associated endonuclease Cas1 [Deinococcus metallilatus]|nr:type I-E CRISPR-associated endonuclease Cas1 [Deinococcus metallilatus]RXJ09559.1 type I-E CRISPR-associated endonuclease Cas1 [Deinococcus metallilatus]TLK29080.1 type I-E CRISPR-associated endonuclease Cas1 [Deinococcus metallilatus]GMA16859.1 CRISPR-associated endonuclease Cas1 2 [Deinococcus metallilatus]
MTGGGIIWHKQNLRELPKFRDGTTYLYLEHTRLEQDGRGVRAYHPDGMVTLPVASLSVLLLGPGCSVSHEAVKALSNTGCSLLWVGEGGVRLYASGLGETRSAVRLHRQARLWANTQSRLRVVRQMYAMRFPEGLPEDLTLQQIRGREGARVRDAYARYSKAHGVKWDARQYKMQDWDRATPLNKAVSAGNTCLYGLAHAAILATGYSPALGFVHTGKMLSFVYDVADLYKVEVVLPVAFREAATPGDDLERRVRTGLRDHMTQLRLLERMAADLHHLLGGDEPDADDLAPGDLWDPEGDVRGGVNHG